MSKVHPPRNLFDDKDKVNMLEEGALEVDELFAHVEANAATFDFKAPAPVVVSDSGYYMLALFGHCLIVLCFFGMFAGGIMGIVGLASKGDAECDPPMMFFAVLSIMCLLVTGTIPVVGVMKACGKKGKDEMYDLDLRVWGRKFLWVVYGLSFLTFAICTASLVIIFEDGTCVKDDLLQMKISGWSGALGGGFFMGISGCVYFLTPPSRLNFQINHWERPNEKYHTYARPKTNAEAKSRRKTGKDVADRFKRARGIVSEGPDDADIHARYAAASKV